MNLLPGTELQFQEISLEVWFRTSPAMTAAGYLYRWRLDGIDFTVSPDGAVSAAIVNANATVDRVSSRPWFARIASGITRC